MCSSDLKVPYDPQRDFAAVALVARSPYLLVAHPSFPARGVRELIAVAKGSPGQVNFASSGSASLPHLAGELFQLMAGVKMNHIPYKGGTPATIDTLAGQVPIIFNNMLNAVPHVKSGKMRALGVTGAQRTAILPQVPTISESGLKGYEVNGWYGLLGPAAMSPDSCNLSMASAENGWNSSRRFFPVCAAWPLYVIPRSPRGLVNLARFRPWPRRWALK